jgi:hypothetical protein
MLYGMDSQSPLISSFVIRFVLQEASEDAEIAPPASYRGSIRHIQSEEELHFQVWEEAVAFISRYVPLQPQKGPDGL